MGSTRYGLILTAIDLQKLEIFGYEYIQHHFMRSADEEMYKNYLTNALRAIAENTSKAYGGLTMNHPFFEIMDAKYNKDDEPEESPEQVVHGIMDKLKRMKK